MLTQTGELLYGAEYPAGSGRLHYDFELRLPTIDDNIAAIDEVGATSTLRLNVAMLARCLVRLGDIPAEAITAKLVGGLVDEDYDVLVEKRETLKKKRRRASATSPTTEQPSSSLGDTAFPSPASAS